MKAAEIVSAQRQGRMFRRLLEQLSRLSGEDLSAEQFFRRFLDHMVRALRPEAAAVWIVNEDGEFVKPPVSSGLDRISDRDGVPLPTDFHSCLLRTVAERCEGVVLLPAGSLPGSPSLRNPTDLVLALAPLRVHRRVAAVVEVFLPSDRDAEDQDGRLLVLREMCKVAADFLKNRRLSDLELENEIRKRFQRFSHSVHGGLRLHETARSIANESRRLTECDRVTVMISIRGGKVRIEAIGDQIQFDRRASVVARLAELASAVVSTGEPLQYFGEPRELLPQVEKALDAYLDVSPSKIVVIWPLQEPWPSNGEDGVVPGKKPTAAIGALAFEFFRTSAQPPEFAVRVEGIRQIARQALANALEFDGTLLAPLSRLVRRVGLLRRRTGLKIAAAGLFLLVLALAYVPADFALEGRGTLEPVGRHDVFAPMDSVVRQVFARHDLVVRPGEPLLQLQNTDVEVALRELRGQHDAQGQRLRVVNASLLDRKLKAADRERLHGERAQLVKLLESLDDQIRLTQSKLDELLMRSPVAARVVTWDVEQLLSQRPVVRGQLLLSLADVEGEWELHIQMPEDRMGHISRARNQLGEELSVTYVLATDPGRTRRGFLREIHARAQVQEQDGNTVLLRVAIDKSQLAQLRRGATAVAKVHCGRRSLGFVWFHDLWEFIQSRILFRL